MYKFSKLEGEKEIVKLFKEKNCCSVTALSLVKRWSFRQAQEFLLEHCGRQTGKGLCSSKLNNLHAALGGLGKVRLLPYSRTNKVTLNKFCEQHSSGVYLVCVSKHILAIKDGVVYDHWDKKLRRVEWVLEVGK